MVDRKIYIESHSYIKPQAMYTHLEANVPIRNKMRVVIHWNLISGKEWAWTDNSLHIVWWIKTHFAIKSTPDFFLLLLLLFLASSSLVKHMWIWTVLLYAYEYMSIYVPAVDCMIPYLLAGMCVLSSVFTFVIHISRSRGQTHTLSTRLSSSLCIFHNFIGHPFWDGSLDIILSRW